MSLRTGAGRALLDQYAPLFSSYRTPADRDSALGRRMALEAALRAVETEAAEGVDRLRQQNHEAAVRRDEQMAEIESTLARYRNAYARAEELVRGSPVDWTDHAKGDPAGWWRYTSQQNRDIIAAAVLAARGEKP